MNPYRQARNRTLVALSAADEIVHLTTEAAIDSAGGAPVDKTTLLAQLTALQQTAAAEIAAAIKGISEIA